MKKYFKGFLMAISMFTIIPLPKYEWDDEGGKNIMKFYPVIGLIVGVIWYGVFRILNLLGASIMVTTAVTLITPFILTGMLHLDGYMDVCDALLSRRDKQEKLRILKDPHTGAFAVISVIMLFILNFSTLHTVISNNIANANTTGFKSETLISKTFDDVLIKNNDKYVNGKGTTQELGTLNLGVKIDEVTTNYEQGVIVETENETDFALNGKGFFTVRDEQGNVFYTRDGGFNINGDGYLVTSSGAQVLNSNNQPMYVGGSSISVDSNNNVVLSSGAVHKFNIVDFDDYSSLNKVGQNLYSGEGAIATNNYRVQNMQKESSNVDIIESTAALMSNLRAFEANQKVVQAMDSTLSKIANEIGTVR